MKLSTKVRYAVCALTELAGQVETEFIPLRQLAASQNISIKYLEQMAMQLKIAGILQSARGADGGYRLARPADQITVWDIYCVLDTFTELVDCRKSNCADGNGECSRWETCPVKNVWTQLSHAVKTVLQATTLKDLADQVPTECDGVTV